jgi:hypothetical protein
MGTSTEVLEASTEVLEAYRRLWKEGDKEERRRLAEVCLTKDMKYYVQGFTGDSRDDFLTYLAEHQESANKRSFVQHVEQHHEQVMLQWEQREPDGSSTLKGTDYGQVDPKGLIKRISSFQGERVKREGIVEDVRTWAKENPIQALGLAGAILYTLLRIPLSVFYLRLGVSPEDVGFSNVTILLQSFSLYILAFVLVTSFLLGIFLIAGIVALFNFQALRRQRARGIQQQIRDAIRQLPRAFLTLLLVYAPVGLLLALIFAYSDAEYVRHGSALRGLPRPWRAPAVQALWIDKTDDMENLPGCRALRLLGATDKSVVLFDWTDGDVYHVQPDKVTVRVKGSKKDCPADILGPAVIPPPPKDIQEHKVWEKTSNVHPHCVARDHWAMTDFVVRQPYVRSIEVRVGGVDRARLSLIRPTGQNTWQSVASKVSTVRKGRAKVIFSEPVDVKAYMNRRLFLRVSNITRENMTVYFTTRNVNKNVKGYLWCNRSAATCVHRGDDLNAVVIGWQRPR